MNNYLQLYVKKYVSFIFILFVIGGIPGNGFSKTIYADGQSINIRSGPGLDYTIIAVIRMDQAMDLLEESEKWLKVKMTNGKIGWISRKRVKTEKPDSVIIADLNETINRQKKVMKELKIKFKEAADKEKKLSVEIKRLTLESDALKMENNELKNSEKLLWISGALIAALFIWLTGFFAGHFRIERENKRFKKMHLSAINLSKQ